MAATNGSFGSIQGPFAADEEILTRVQEDCAYQIDYLSKLGITFVGNIDFVVEDKNYRTYRREKLAFVRINGKQFQIGRTRMLELQDVQVRSIQFVQDTDDNVYIDYQYVKKQEEQR